MQPTAFFIDRCNRLLEGGYDAYFPQDAPLFRGLTVNPLRLDPPERFAEIAPFAVSAAPFAPGGFYLTDPASRPGLHPYHHAGVYYLQEPSASAPAALLGVQPGDRVLDLCAAPGGKSAQLAGALGGSGLLVSNEFTPSRCAPLLSNLERMGVRGALVTNETAARLGEAFCGYFDRILVDAPCSGEGMFRKEEAAVAQHSQKLIDHCASLQRQLLDEIAPALRPGGVLVYSTCTFSPEEDEGTVAAFLCAHPEFSLEDAGASFGCGGHPSCCVEGPLETEKVRRIYPVHGGEGQFMARLRKAGDAPCTLPRGVVSPTKLPAEARAFLEEQFPSLADAPFVLRGEKLYLLGQETVFLPGKLRALRVGVEAGALLRGHGKARFAPAHSLYMACSDAAARRVALSEEEAWRWLRGEELDSGGAQNGWTAVTFDGFPLGMGKVSGGRLKNHYPKGLRNLK